MSLWNTVQTRNRPPPHVEDKLEHYCGTMVLQMGIEREGGREEGREACLLFFSKQPCSLIDASYHHNALPLLN